jgi:hypothetical protein
MKRSLLLLLPTLFIGTACERHSASSLPAHGGEHGAEPKAPAAAHVAEKAPAASPEAPAKGEPAAKFFEQQPK